jgi:hypothetical protein
VFAKKVVIMRVVDAWLVILISNTPKPTPMAALGPQKVTAVRLTAEGNHNVGQRSRCCADQSPK